MLSLSCATSKLAAVVIALSTLSPPPYGQPHLLQGLKLGMGVFAQCELHIKVHEKLGSGGVAEPSLSGAWFCTNMDSKSGVTFLENLLELWMNNLEWKLLKWKLHENCGVHTLFMDGTYEEIHELYERHQKRNQDFIPMDSEKEAQKSGKRLKRVAGSYATQKSPKKSKVMKSAKNVTEEEAAEYEKEKDELRLSLKIISGDDSEVNYEPLSRRFPIVNWEYKLLGNVDAKDMYVYKLTRADGSSSYHGDMQAFLRRLDRQDLNDLYRLVQERFQDHPLEGHDLLLWGDLRMLFDPDEKDELWMNQLDWKLLKWKLHENCGVHTLFMDGTPMEINMLVEKKYPLIKELLEKVLNLQLEAEEESTMAFKLIKFIKSMLEE
ncbi:hypothetical protein Tco_0933282 [Tanacetum coccineum]